MSKKQWGHGYHAGEKQGFVNGYNYGKSEGKLDGYDEALKDTGKAIAGGLAIVAGVATAAFKLFKKD